MTLLKTPDAYEEVFAKLYALGKPRPITRVFQFEKTGNWFSYSGRNLVAFGDRETLEAIRRAALKTAAMDNVFKEIDEAGVYDIV